MRVLVGSKNPIKIASVADAFGRYFPDVEVEGHEVPSSVASQPIGEDTRRGAYNRALALSKLGIQGADYFVGLEGGIIQIGDTWFNHGVQCVMDPSGRTGYGLTPGYAVPTAFVEPLLAGRELGVLSDELFGQTNLKQKGGIVSYLTRGQIDRTSLYVNGLIMALAPFLNEELYFNASPQTRSS